MKEKRPNTMVAIFGFNRYTEKLNGRIAMIAIIVMFLIEYFYNINLIKLLYLDIKLTKFLF